MGFFHSLFGFEGRLNRAPFWGYSVLLVVVIIIVQLIALFSIVGPQLAELAQGVTGDAPPPVQDVVALFTSMGPRLGWVAVIIQILFSFPAAALSVKRRHDRDRSGIDVWIYIGATLVVSIVQLLGIGMTSTLVRGVEVATPTPPMQLVQLLLAIAAIYLFVVLGFLRGTIGPNKYGADPLGG